MQTFLPYPDFDATARVLDYRRLGKQRVETMQIMIALNEGRGWVNHPAVKMWEGFQGSLFEYQTAICKEWVARGYRDNVCWEKTRQIFLDGPEPSPFLPPWLGDPEFHLAHQSNLLRKDFEYYSEFFSVPDDLPYIWPVVT